MQSNHLLKTQKSFSDIYSIYYVRMLRFSQTYVIAVARKFVRHFFR